MSKKYPKEIFVQKEKDVDDSYFLVWETADEANNGELMIYKLDAIVKKSTKTVLE